MGVQDSICVNNQTGSKWIKIQSQPHQTEAFLQQTSASKQQAKQPLQTKARHYKQPIGNPVLCVNKHGTESEMYAVQVDHLNYREEMGNYNKRKIRADNIVNVYDLQQSQNIYDFLLRNFNLMIYTERIRLRLSDLGGLSQKVGLFILHESLKGYWMLMDYGKSTVPSADKIGFNRQHAVKVWINNNFGINFSPEEREQHLMVEQLVDLCEEKTLQRSFDRKIRARLNFIYPFRFRAVIGILQQYWEILQEGRCELRQHLQGIPHNCRSISIGNIVRDNKCEKNNLIIGKISARIPTFAPVLTQDPVREQISRNKVQIQNPPFLTFSHNISTNKNTNINDNANANANGHDYVSKAKQNIVFFTKTKTDGNHLCLDINNSKPIANHKYQNNILQFLKERQVESIHLYEQQKEQKYEQIEQKHENQQENEQKPQQDEPKQEYIHSKVRKQSQSPDVEKWDQMIKTHLERDRAPESHSLSIEEMLKRVESFTIEQERQISSSRMD